MVKILDQSCGWNYTVHSDHSVSLVGAINGHTVVEYMCTLFPSTLTPADNGCSS